jgi:LCP family protein required for cell wall assembly
VTSRAARRSARRGSQLRAFTHRYVIALGVALVFTVGGVVGANIAIDKKFDEVSRVEVKLAPSDPGTPGNFLLIGSDTRAFATTAEQEEAFGSKDELTGQRSDTIMVVHVEPDSRTSVVVSFPRDLWVDIPGVGESKINAAFNDGPQKVIDTLQANYGIPINHYLEVDFATFAGIVDAVGRVPVYLPAEARDEKTGFSVPAAGCYRLDGDQALQYVRSRYLEYYDPETGEWNSADAIPDLGRIARQQNFIRRIGSIAYRAALGNPLKAGEIADNVIPKLVVDSGLTRTDVFKLVNTFRTVDPADPNSIEMLTLPTYGSTSDDGQSILLPDDPDAGVVLARLRTFDPPPAVPTGILPAQVRVRVLNGSGTDGLAASTLDSLQREFGFAGAGLGNAPRTSATEIRYRPGLQKAGRLVASYFGGVGAVSQDAGIADADVVVVLGADFTAVSAPPGVAPAVTSSTTSTTMPDSTAITLPPGVDASPKALRKYQKFMLGLARTQAETGCVQ